MSQHAIQTLLDEYHQWAGEREELSAREPGFAPAQWKDSDDRAADLLHRLAGREPAADTIETRMAEDPPGLGTVERRGGPAQRPLGQHAARGHRGLWPREPPATLTTNYSIPPINLLGPFRFGGRGHMVPFFVL